MEAFFDRSNNKFYINDKYYCSVSRDSGILWESCINNNFSEFEEDKFTFFQNGQVKAWVELYPVQVHFEIRGQSLEDGLPIPKKSLAEALRAWKQLVSKLDPGVVFYGYFAENDGKGEKRKNLFKKLGFIDSEDPDILTFIVE